MDQKEDQQNYIVYVCIVGVHLVESRCIFLAVVNRVAMALMNERGNGILSPYTQDWES